MNRIVDHAPGTGVYEGDLAYGRALGVEPKTHKDFPAERVENNAKNKPIMPLKLVDKRDVALWTKDSTMKEAKKKYYQTHNSTNLQEIFFANHLIESYLSSAVQMRANIHLKVGRKRI